MKDEQFNLEALSDLELLQLHNSILRILKTRRVIRTYNQPIGDYAEWLVAKTLKLELSLNSTSGYDAKDTDGVRYQIKARQITSENPSVQLSAIRGLESHEFDYLIGILFDLNYTVIKAVRVPWGIIQHHAKYTKHTNSHRLLLRSSLIADPQVVDITELFQIGI